MIITQQFRSDFNRFRLGIGGRNVALPAWRNAKTLALWRKAEAFGLVRLRQREECDSCQSVFGDEHEVWRNGHKLSKEASQKDLKEMLERDGVWVCISEYFHLGKWIPADSIGMCVGYNDPLDPFENCYIIELMAAALKEAEAETYDY